MRWKEVSALFNKRNLIGAALVLGLSGLAPATLVTPASAVTALVCNTQNGLTACDDDFSQATGTYESVFANTVIYSLPVTNNDPSKGADGYQLCLRSIPLDAPNWGTVHLYDGRLEVDLGIKLISDTASFGYYPCTPGVMGPLTAITIHIKKLHVMNSQRVGAHKMRIFNRNSATATCDVSPSKPWKHVLPNSSVLVPRHAWHCWIQQKLGVAKAGPRSYL